MEILLKKREWQRLQAVRRVLSGTWKSAEAAQALRLSVRQVRRVCRRVEAKGDAGVLHGNRGRPPPNGYPLEMEAKVVKLARGKYTGFNDQHFVEKLGTVEGIEVSRSTARRWLRGAGIGAARKRRPPRHRQRRERKPQAGFMLLWDGSRHEWLEGRGPMLCLVGAIDDATGEMLPGAHFVEQECTAAYLATLRAIAKDKGLPWSAYGDRHGIFRRNDDAWTLEEELRGEQDPTQLGRALEALGIERIDALSPQAKGRVERLWGTLQDRLCSELRLAKAKTIEDGNRILAGYRDEHNRKHAVPPKDAMPAWRRVPRDLDLDRILSFVYPATVLNDNTVRKEGMVIQIPPGPGRRSYAKSLVDLHQLLDGSWRVYHRDSLIAVAPATAPGEIRSRKAKKRPAASRAFRHAVMGL